MTRAQAVSNAWELHCVAGTYLKANRLEQQTGRGGCGV